MSFLTSRCFRHLPRSSLCTSSSVRTFASTRSWRLEFPVSDSEFEQLKQELKARELPALFETPTTTPAAQFETTLRDFLREPFTPLQGQNGSSGSPYRRFGREGKIQQPIPFSYHLLYFPPQTSLSELLPDSTDPAQSPGAPFDRRMWAGGRIEQFPRTGSGRDSVFRNGVLAESALNERAVCVESISDVQLKGTGDSQKILVTLERRIGAISIKEEPTREQVTKLLAKDSDCAVIEHRNLIFMNNSKMPKPGSKPPSPPKVLKAPNPADHSASLAPNASLLFRFSALTFNAHRIHLDREFCRDVEGHRNLIVHGPLSVMLMSENLRGYLERQQPLLQSQDAAKAASADPSAEFITSLEYRNLAPLFADESLNVCLRKKSGDQDGSAYEVWVENDKGSMCVKGTATTKTFSWLQKQKQ